MINKSYFLFFTNLSQILYFETKKLEQKVAFWSVRFKTLNPVGSISFLFFRYLSSNAPNLNQMLIFIIDLLSFWSAGNQYYPSNHQYSTENLDI